MKTYDNLRALDNERLAIDVTTKGWFGKAKTQTIIISYSNWHNHWMDVVKREQVSDDMSVWLFLNMKAAGIEFKEE